MFGFRVRLVLFPDYCYWHCVAVVDAYYYKLELAHTQKTASYHMCNWVIWIQATTKSMMVIFGSSTCLLCLKICKQRVAHTYTDTQKKQLRPDCNKSMDFIGAKRKDTATATKKSTEFMASSKLLNFVYAKHAMRWPKPYGFNFPNRNKNTHTIPNTPNKCLVKNGKTSRVRARTRETERAAYIFVCWP